MALDTRKSRNGPKAPFERVSIDSVSPQKKKDNGTMERQLPRPIKSSKSCLARPVSRPLLSHSPSLSALTLAPSPFEDEAESRQSLEMSGENIAVHQTSGKIGTMSQEPDLEEDNKEEDEDYVLVHEISFTQPGPDFKGWENNETRVSKDRENGPKSSKVPLSPHPGDKDMRGSSDVCYASSPSTELEAKSYPDFEQLFEKEKRTVLVLQKQKQAISKDLSYFSQTVDELTSQNSCLERKLENERSKSRSKDEDLGFLLDKIRTVNNKARELENISRQAKADLEIAQKKASDDQERLYGELQARNSTIEMLTFCLNDALKQVEVLTQKDPNKYHKRGSSRKYDPEYNSIG
ncbi:hypothetical protein CLU79DRAFT_105594 [Phycomyces nitens]|nr:hypothetical protein CLU79DRAFT_105594 [Phycomyces nitens]